MRILFCLWALQAFAAFNLTWGTPAVGLDTNPPIGDTDSNATIAIDPMGNAVASWSRTTGTSASENIWVAVYNHSLRVWTGAVKISGSGSASNSQVALDKNGNATIIWEEGFPTQICCRYLSSEGVWTPDLSMPAETVQKSKNAQTLPQISVDSEGNLLTIWTEFYKMKYNLHSASKLNGMGWVDLGRISSGSQSVTIIPSKALSLNPTGKGIAVWQETNGDLSEIYGSIFENGTWTDALTIAAERGKSAETPSAAIDFRGKIVFVYCQQDKILSKTIQNGLHLSRPLVVSNPDYVSKRPHVGIDAEGNAVVVFERYNLMHKFITGATLPNDAFSWTSPIDISAPSPADAAAAGYPVFSMNEIGDGVVIWKEWTGTNMIVQGAGYSLGTWSFIKTLSSLKGDSGAPVPAYDIAVTLNKAGNILAIWPEDPSRIGPQQIKTTSGVGLANRGPLPPIPDPITIFSGIVTGKQVLHRFPAHSDLINILSWTSPSPIDFFKVYRGSLSSLIATTKETRYEDHQRIPGQPETYLITAVDQHGQESGPMTIVVNPR